MDALLRDWGYLGVFASILLTGLGFPMPEELPVVAGGAMCTHDDIRWWIMLPVCIVGVIIGDSFLYFIGYFFGAKLVQRGFIRDRLLPPERLEKITKNFQEYGVKILLFARLTPGIRTPIFLTAGITKLPLTRFLIADGIYAIPGVSLLFLLGYWFTDSIVDLIRAEAGKAKAIIILVVLVGGVGYLLYRAWRKPMVTGNPAEMPPLVGKVTNTLDHMADKIMHPGSHAEVTLPPPPPPAEKPSEQTPTP